MNKASHKIPRYHQMDATAIVFAADEGRSSDQFPKGWNGPIMLATPARFLNSDIKALAALV
jgi:hypothetical protein